MTKAPIMAVTVTRGEGLDTEEENLIATSFSVTEDRTLTLLDERGRATVFKADEWSTFYADQTMDEDEIFDEPYSPFKLIPPESER